MKNKVPLIKTLVLMLFLYIFAFSCLKPQNRSFELNKNSQHVQNLTGEEISRLGNGVLARFPATLVKRSGSNCIELFAQNDFKKFNGDGKYAVFSIIAPESHLSDWFEGNKDTVVTGKMTFIRDVIDPSKTCGIITGKLFEISEIE